MPRLASRMSRAVPSAIMAVAEKAKRLKAEGRDIISFSIGVPGFLPGPHVYEAARAALAKDSGAYGSNRGPDALLDAWIGFLARNGLPGYTRREVATGVGGKHVLFQVMYALFDEGDEILIPTPYWTSYVDIAEILGLKIKLLRCGSEHDYKVSAERLAEALTPDTRGVLLNNPSNPTGMVYSREEMQGIADVLAGHSCWILSDDIYSQLIFDGIGWQNVLKCRPELRDRTIIMDSISKSYGMPGWRVGYLAGPAAVADAVTTLNSNSITNLPEVVNAAAIAALNGPQDATVQACADFAKKRDLVLAALDGLPGIHCPRPQGAFYVFPDISGCFGKRHGDRVIETDADFCDALLEAKGVACVPGRAFGEPNALRISYACADAVLADGLARIADFVRSLV